MAQSVAPLLDTGFGAFGALAAIAGMGRGEGRPQSRCNPLKGLVSEKEMKGNERSFQGFTDPF